MPLPSHGAGMTKREDAVAGGQDHPITGAITAHPAEAATPEDRALQGKLDSRAPLEASWQRSLES